MTTYYIDYKNGNDTTGNGSTGTPWKTLTQALASVSNSDTILARGSDAADEIYYEYAKSTALTGLTIQADTGHTPTWTPAVARTSWSLTAGQSLTYETAYTPAGIYYAWNGATVLTLKASIAQVEAAENSYYADVAGDKLYVHIAGGGSPSTIHSAYSVSGLLTSAGTGITYRGIRCQWCGVGLFFNKAGLADDCTVRYHGGEVFGDRIGIRVDAAVAVTITDCSVSGVYSATYGTVGIGSTTAGATLTISGCTVSGARYGIHCAVATTITVDDCDFATCSDGVSFDGSGVIAATVTNCRFTDWNHGCIQFSGANITGTAHHNVAYFSGSLAHNNAYISESGSVSYWYHNVAYGPENASGNGYGVIVNAGTATFYNNAMVDCKEGYVQPAIYSPTITSDYNDAYGCAVNYHAVRWPKGAHDLEVAPGFTDAANHDFTLAAGSALIDAGVAVAGINDDYKGLAPDIGAFERAAGVPKHAMYYQRMRRQ